ncbi:uncharacterized protein MELLADRAFT_71039 [Melampsora larici-populina 98AG31]|uniref:Uncharacterized protein n=1 Tax=Melampsora larici-populina (strain 98AG31 / pathotype 3-4-7) TaxID=747676 RepID=F4RBB6_MELLP|nr:uncharacterized protein MELLADRAFT_71039 [Melampsora larici-populina 98AG31]EGG10389.1 hypothetical protein MELLADRAFT_71039 [Melampsora larici-populina 98AG31]
MKYEQRTGEANYDYPYSHPTPQTSLPNHSQPDCQHILPMTNDQEDDTNRNLSAKLNTNQSSLPSPTANVSRNSSTEENSKEESQKPIRPKLINPHSTSQTLSNSSNRFQLYHHSSTYQLIYKSLLIFLLFIQSFVLIGFFASVYISLDGFIKISESVEYRTILAYLLIFIIATIFSVFIAIDSLLSKNVNQLIGLCLFNIAMSVYGAILPRQINHTIEPLSPGSLSADQLHSIQWRVIVVPAISGFCSIILFMLTWYFYREFGWYMYKQLGADIKLRKALRIKYTFYMLQKFNLFFLIGFCIQTVLYHGSNPTVQNIVLPSIALLVSCFVVLLASVAVERELKWIMALYYLVWTLAMTFLCYEIAKIYPKATEAHIQRSFILFASLTFVMLLSTGVFSIICCCNFGIGLKERRLRSPWSAALHSMMSNGKAQADSNNPDNCLHPANSRPILD